MATHRARKPARPAAVLLSLFERFGAQTTVDREAQVIRNVKVCGLTSDNGRAYPRSVLAAAKALYEGVTVYTDHPPRPGQTRGAREAIGILQNVRDEPDGLRADLHYLPKHALTEDVLSDVERKLGIFGLSHNVDARVERQGNVDHVTEIVKVRSVDLVTDPATNKNLWESRRMATTLKQIIESSKLAKKAKKALLEMDGMGDTLAAPVEEPTESDARKQLAQAVATLLQSDDPADHDLGARVMKLLKPDGGIEEEDGEDEEDMEEAVGDSSKNQAGQRAAMNAKDPEGKKKGGGNWRHEEGRKQQRPAPGTLTVTEARVKALCKLAGVEATQTVLEATRGASEDSALAIIELAKGQKTGKSGGPRSSTPGTRPVIESKDATRPPEDPAKLASWLSGK